VILGLSPYKKTPGDIYFSKVYDLPEDDAPEDFLTTGNRLENPLLDFAADELGVSILRNQWRVADDGPGKGIFAAHPDAIIQGKPEGIEAKYANAAMGQDYGEEGTDAIPAHVVVQAQHQMYAARLQKVWVPVALAGFSLEFKLFSVPRDDELIDQIVTKGMEWWNRHVVPKVPPETYYCDTCQKGFFDVPGIVQCPTCGGIIIAHGPEVPPIDLLKRIQREPQSWVDLPKEAEKLIFEYQQAGFREKEDKDEREELKAKIVHLLGEAEAGHLADGRDVTFLEQKSAPVTNTTLFLAEHPDLYERYVKQGKHRCLRIKELKKPKGEGIAEIIAS